MDSKPTISPERTDGVLVELVREALLLYERNTSHWHQALAALTELERRLEERGDPGG